MRGEFLGTHEPLAWKRLEGPRWWAQSAYGLTRGIEEVGVFDQHRQRAALAGLEARHPCSTWISSSCSYASRRARRLTVI